jgi:hypothetical protein
MIGGGRRKLRNEELHNFFSSPNIIRMTKSRKMRWAGHMALMGDNRNAYRILMVKPGRKNALARARRRWENTVTCRPFLGYNTVQHTVSWRRNPRHRLGTERISVSRDIQLTHFRVNEDSTKASVDTNKQPTFPMVTARLYKRPRREELIHSAFIRESSFVKQK